VPGTGFHYDRQKKEAIAEGSYSMAGTSGLKIERLFHPTFMVSDLEAASALYERIFGVSSVTIPYSELGHAYRTLTVVADCCIENISPEQRHLSPFRMYTDIVGNHLFFPCFYVSDMQDAVYKLHHIHGIGLTASGTGAPVYGCAPGNALRTLVYTNPNDTGIMWEFWEGEQEWFDSSPLADPRMKPGWRYRPPADDDPLAVEYLSHHTVVLSNFDKAQHFLVDICRGELFEESENEILQTESRWIAVGESPAIFELARPRADGPASRDLQRCGNTVHSITFKVRDLDSARDHLSSRGITFETDSESLLVADPETTLGLRMGFCDELRPGDPRHALAKSVITEFRGVDGENGN
jgi:catechol 2,3-dioxygenase-like lactoylglutathione lyase family enzyme